MTFTIEQIKNYLRSQDSLGDVLYNLSEENILKANKKYKSKKEYKEDWNPDWKGDPNDELRWKGW